VATFYAARSEIITPLPWLTFALPFSHAAVEVQAAAVAQAQFDRHRGGNYGRVRDGGNAICRNIEGKEEPTTSREPQPLLLHLVTPGIDLLPGDLVALSYLRDRRLIGAHRQKILSFSSSLQRRRRSNPSISPRIADPHLRYVANDVVKHVS
jgi:hypothetical protein